jgi:coiled-coil domain-containing protein 25
MNEGETWDTIPADLLNDCAQLTKANSIEGMTRNEKTACDANVL